jgi:type I restriction enzyme, S subunit
VEVNPGYKRTEVGVIPEDWDVKSVGELAQIKTGPFGTLLKAKEYSGSDGVPLISVGEVGSGRFKVTKDTPLVPATVVRRLPQYLLRTGDIVFGRKGAVERSALVTEREHGWFLGSDGISVRPQPECFPPYLACQFQRHEVQEWLLQNATGTTMPSLNQVILGRVQIPYAPLPEQRSIAAVLGDVDALLEGLTRLVTKKRDIKRAAVQQLLSGRTRLPGFHAQWEETTLGEIGECIIGLTYKPENVVEHGLLVLRSSNIQNGRLTYDDNVYVNLDVAEHLYAREGDILVCVRNGSRALIGKSALIDSRAAGVTFGAFMSVYRTKHWRFILHAFQADDVQRQIRDNIGATINQITNKDLRAFRVKLPPEDEQAAVAAVLSEMDAELDALEARRDKTRALKQAMMQELLTGKTRLVEPASANEAAC